MQGIVEQGAVCQCIGPVRQGKIMKINIKDAIKSVKSEAMTNVILLSHMPNIKMEDKMYIMYFIGTMKGKDYILDFDKDGVADFEIGLDKVKINKEK